MTSWKLWGRALFVSAYADACDEGNLPDCDTAGPGDDWMDVSPDTPQTALDAGKRLALRIAALNGASIGELLNRAYAADGLDPECPDTYEPKYRSDFGHYLAMQSLGHGVGWFDDHAEFPLKLPYVEFYIWGQLPSGEFDIYTGI